MFGLHQIILAHKYLLGEEQGGVLLALCPGMGHRGRQKTGDVPGARPSVCLQCRPRVLSKGMLSHLDLEGT